MREPRWKALKKCTKKNTVASAPVTELELEVLGLVGQRHDENDSAGLSVSLSLSLSLSICPKSPAHGSIDRQSMCAGGLGFRV